MHRCHPRRLIAMSALTLCVLVAGQAHAHDPPIAWDVAIGPDGQAAAWISRGLITPAPSPDADSPPAWSLLCNERLDLINAEQPALRFADGGSLMIATSNGLWHADAQGCDLRKDAAFDGVPLVGLERDPTTAGRWYTLSGPTDGASQLYRSDDDGATWRSVRVFADGDYATGLRVADDGSRVTLALRVAASTREVSYVVQRTGVDGSELAELDVEYDRTYDFRVKLLEAFAVDTDIATVPRRTDGPQVVLGVRRYRASELPDRLLALSPDGASAAWAELHLADQIEGFAADADAAWLATAAGLQVNSDAALGWASPPPDGAPRWATCVRQTSLGQAVCSRAGEGDAVTLFDGPRGPARTVARFEDIAQRSACPNDTVAQREALDAACIEPWADWESEQASLPSHIDTPATPVSGGCATQPHEPPSVVGLMVLAAGALLRRRRR